MNIITIGIEGDKEKIKIRSNNSVLGLEEEINDISKDYLEINQVERKGGKDVYVQTLFIKKLMIDFITISKEED